jgi:uncharacterized LabA/DUF88 family protein
MPNPQSKQQKLAVLIDAENASPARLRAILRRAACYGVLAIKRAYGDWSNPRLQRFKTLLLRHAIEPVQLFSCARGKNAADIALSLDAMDLMHMGQVTGICLVSSDSDFTPVAIRLRREDVRVYGFGERQTPIAFVAACSTFIYTDSLAG